MSETKLCWLVIAGELLGRKVWQVATVLGKEAG